MVSGSCFAGLGEVVTDASNQIRLGLLQLVGAFQSLGFEASESTTDILVADVRQDITEATCMIGGSTTRDILKGRTGVFRRRGGRRRI